MTKEKLIALSDLNREDNIKYISSEAQGIAITLDSDRYAPNLCKLERAYICGRRKSEEQIEQLEKENAELKGEADSVLDNWCKGDDPCPHLKNRDEQLTNAKELLKQWLQTSKASGCDNINIVTDTEQFLKEE